MHKLLHPPVWIPLFVPILSFAAPIAVFVCRSAENTLTYLIYCVSACFLSIRLAAVPMLINRLKSAIINSKRCGFSC